jgi:fructosamine-3-kinase
VDLAMTELFGRFPEPFYQGYDELFPMEKGYESRKNLYNLYHVLNHFNLFGGSYQSQVNTMISQLIGC